MTYAALQRAEKYLIHPESRVAAPRRLVDAVRLRKPALDGFGPRVKNLETGMLSARQVLGVAPCHTGSFESAHALRP